MRTQLSAIRAEIKEICQNGECSLFLQICLTCQYHIFNMVFQIFHILKYVNTIFLLPPPPRSGTNQID